MLLILVIRVMLRSLNKTQAEIWHFKMQRGCDAQITIHNRENFPFMADDQTVALYSLKANQRLVIMYSNLIRHTHTT